MSQWWDIPMLFSGGLFAGGVLSIAWERIPAWREADPASFPTDFAHTLQRVDRLQPALLVICLVSTLGFAISAHGTPRILAAVAAAAELVILIGSMAWLVPIQRQLAAPGPAGQPPGPTRPGSWPDGLAATSPGPPSHWCSCSSPSPPPPSSEDGRHPGGIAPVPPARFRLCRKKKKIRALTRGISES